MVTATLFMVASSDIIRKRDLFLGIDVAAETAFFVAGRAGVPCRHALIRLENESVCVHRLSGIWVAFPHYPHFGGEKMQKVQKMRGYGQSLE